MSTSGPSSMLAKGETTASADNRINNIMKVDTNALLSTLRDLELKMSEYYRADEVPMWATSLLPRLEILEMKSSKLEKKINAAPHAAAAPAGAAPALGGGGVGEMQLESRIYDRIKGEMDSQLGTTKLTMEGKVGSIGLELDRLHKLLQIRPTTSELQRVVLQIQEIKQQVSGNMNELSGNVESIVRDKVVSEMSSIMDKLKIIEGNSNASMKIMLDKMENITSEMGTMRVSVKNGMDELKADGEAAQAGLEDHAERIELLRSDMEQQAEGVNEQFIEMQRQAQQTNDVINELSTSLQVQVATLQNHVDEHASSLERFREETDRTAEANNARFGQVQDSIQEVTSAYMLDGEQLRASMGELRELVAEVQQTSNTTGAAVDQMMKADVLGTLAAVDAKQVEDRKQLADLDERLGVTSGRVSKLNKSVTALQELQEPLQGQLTEHDRQIKELDADLQRNVESITKDLQRQMSDLVVVRDEAAVIKTIGQASDQRVKIIHATMADLLKTTETFAQRFMDVSMRIEREKMDMLKQVQDSEEALKVSMAEKHAEIEGAIANVKENLDLMAQSEHHHHHRGGRGGMSRGIRGGTAGRGGAGASGTAGGGGGVASSAVEAGAIPAVSLEEQLAVAQTHAQFIADLCINFEEVAIRRSDVPQIPGVIIENVIATVQALTAFIANCADAEAVTHVLRANPGEVQYEDVVQNKRYQKLEQFLGEMHALLMENNKVPGQVRLEAREKFTNMLRMALDLCISKHEQVIVTNSSRVGRVRIPTCIACDRPLLEKVRQDRQKDPKLDAAIEAHNRPAQNSFNFHADIASKPNTVGAMSSIAASKPPAGSAMNSIAEDALSNFESAMHSTQSSNGGKERIARTKDGRPILKESVRLPMAAPESSSPPAGLRGGSRGGGGGGQGSYVLRGGFKMPRPSGGEGGGGGMSMSSSMPSL